MLRLKQHALKSVSMIEIGTLTQTFIIKARCLKRRLFVGGDKTAETTRIKAG